MFENLVIPIPKRDHITFFEKPPEYNPQENWIHKYMSWPLNYKEWVDIIDSFRKPLFGDVYQIKLIALHTPPYIPNTVPDVFHHREHAADIFEHWFRRNQAIRWQMKQLLLAYRRRHMDARTIGNTDVGTMEPIPANLQVTVYDWSSRARYHFHADTIHRQIAGALKYQSLAISMPSAPKNPYTNLEWSRGQLMVLYDQIQRRLWDVKRKFMDPAAQAFYHANMSLDLFKEHYGPMLKVECAGRFFRDPTSEYWELLYREVLKEEIFFMIKPKNADMLENLLIDRSFSAELLREWDDVVFAFWCYDQLGNIVLPAIGSMYELIDMTQRLLERTEHIIKTRKKITLAKRRTQARNVPGSEPSESGSE